MAGRYDYLLQDNPSSDEEEKRNKRINRYDYLLETPSQVAAEEQKQNIGQKVGSFVKDLFKPKEKEPEIKVSTQEPLTVPGIPENYFEQSKMKLDIDEYGDVVPAKSINESLSYIGTERLEQAPTPTTWGNIKKFLAKPFKASDEELNARAGVAVAIRNELASKASIDPNTIDLSEIEGNIDTYTKEMGIRTQLTNSEFTQLMMTLSLPSAMVSGISLVTLAQGIGKFAIYSTAIDGALSVVTDKPFGTGLKSLLPDDSSQSAKELVDVIDLIGKVYVTHGMGKIEPKVSEFLTKQKLIEKGVPTTVSLSGQQVKDIWQTGKLTTAEQKAFVRDLKLTTDQIRLVTKEGVTINVATTDIVTITDRSYWAKIKSFFGMPVAEPNIVDVSTPMKYTVGGKSVEVPTTETVSPKSLGGAKVDNVAQNLKNTEKITKETVGGKREQFRLDNDKNINNYAPSIKGMKPTDKVTVWKATTTDIKEGEYVTTTEAKAKSYLKDRSGSKLFNKEVTVSDLVYGDGLKDEVLYSPKKEVTPSPRKNIKPKDMPDGVTDAIISYRPDGTASFNIEVDKALRGNGVGAEAVAKMEQQILDEGVTTVNLPVKQESVGFFEKQGYTATGESDGGLTPMTKTLEKTKTEFSKIPTYDTPQPTADVANMSTKQLVKDLQEQGGHPNQRWQPDPKLDKDSIYTASDRSAYTSEIAKRGLDNVLAELGYPTDRQGMWRNKNTGDEKTLADLVYRDAKAIERGATENDETPYLLENWIPAVGKNTIKEKFDKLSKEREEKKIAEEKAEKKARKVTKTAQKKAETAKQEPKEVYVSPDERMTRSAEDIIKEYKDGHENHSEQGLRHWLEVNVVDTDKVSEVLKKWNDGIIEPNETIKPTTDKGGGGNVRPRQPTDTLPESQDEQKGTGETTKVGGKGVARGVNKVSDTGVGVRPTALSIFSKLDDNEKAGVPFALFPKWIEDEMSAAGMTAEEKKELIVELMGMKSTPMQDVESSIVDLPETLQIDARKDWLDYYSSPYQDRNTIEEQDEISNAFIEKWKKKAIEHNKPSKPSKTTQVDTNKEIEELVAKKGNGTYTDEEKSLLRQYTGAGGLESAGADGRGLLDEYYTPKPIVDFIWSKIKEITMPFTSKGVTKDVPISEMNGMMILEPAAGIGGFFDSKLPSGLTTAYEMNNVSSAILKALHPETRVFSKPFESTFVGLRGEKITPKAEYMLVVGNPPYGEHRGKYLGLGEEPKIIKYEEYFMKRGLDVLQKDGILAYVIPSSFLRGGSSHAKSEITKLGTIIDAYRLPNGVFGTTTIGTDIIFIRKQPLPTDETNTSLYNMAHADRAIRMSNDNWFFDNPDKILGEISKGTGNYGADEVKGTLENAITKAKEEPVEIQDSIPDEVLIENEKEIEKEIIESEDNVESVETPPVKRVPENPTITNEINKKAIIEPKKKDTTMSISDGVSDKELKMWKSVNVTGELSSSYTGGFEPKTFVSKDLAITIEDGEAKYYPNVVYYQGDIYEKLNNLTLFHSQINDAQFKIQQEGLKDVLPKPKPIDKIELQPNSDFAKNIEVISDAFGGGKAKLLDLFEMWYSTLPYQAFGGASRWEITGYIEGRVVNTGDKIYNIEVRKRRREVGNSLFRKFLSEQLTDDQKKTVENIYNRSFNAYHKPDYSKVPLTAEINSTFNPKKKSGKHPLVIKAVQKEGASFLTTRGVGLLGYDVGVGKTLTAIVAINEVMNKGWAKKPLLIVPNGVYRNWINEISEVIPNIKINSLMNLGGAFKGDLKTLEIEDGTLSIITYDGLTKLGFKPETYEDLTVDLKDVMAGVNNTKRGREKESAGIEQQVGKAIKGTTGDRFFEDLGFDHITVDEVQNFKNIFAGAKLEKGQGNEYRNVRGSSSARGIKLYLMSQYILKNNNNRNVFLLSATPFSNSPLEIYSILSLMGKKRLEDIGLKNVNDFMSMYMELKPSFVVKADQTVQEEDVIEKFQNLQELQKIVTEFIDFRTGEEAGVDRPGRIKKTITLNPTTLQNNYIEQAQALFQDKKGGAIVAITELQNITLSPYLSRYNNVSPTYKEFVENSPKIKYAVEAVAQTHKDNPDVGQVIYMPRGVDYMPLVIEYLVKEKGFKPSEIDIVSGGMNVDKKQAIQDKFNKGTVKVLLGTEAIKEGVNLQERSTDLYHLHLPWNPTDMLQVEGRIWRQGNDYSNVRIHYPLIENSVDSFIFQKLETKEKRIRNLWSYKENEINVGDLDFENMKLDLITDPLVRIKAEQTFETKKENQALEKLRVEKAFADRKIDKLANAVTELRSSEKRLKESEEEAKTNPESYAARNLDYYITNASKAQKDVNTIRADLKEKGVDVEDLEKRSAELQKIIDEQQAVVDAIPEKFNALIEGAKEQKYVAPDKPNNYSVLLKEIANDNTTFFKKRAGQDTVRATNTSYTTPSGTADVGGYADVQSAVKTVQNLKAAEFPELLRLSKDIMNDTPTLQAFRRALGKFYSIDGGKMKFHPDIWKTPGLAVKVLSHELGHLSDYTPDRTLIRGNILGRIASLNKFLKGSFGEKEINNIDIRAELKELSQVWKPFDELENPNFTSYRFSSKELYADAISVLFNDPALLQEKAPLFYEAFFDNLDSKPEIKESFNKLWNLLNQGEEAVFNARNEDIDRSFAEAEKIFAAKTLEKTKRKINIIEELRTLFDDRNHKLNKRVKEQVKKGVKIEDRLNPMFDYEGLNYLDAKLKNFVMDNFQPAKLKASEVDGGWESLGKILTMERVIFERSEFANPFGYDPKTAKDFLAGLQKSMPESDWNKLQEAKELLRGGLQAGNKVAEVNGYYKPEMIEQMKENPAYATFMVNDYLDTYISPSIKHQVGTLKDIANPATASIMKAIATQKAIEYNNAKKSAMDFQREFYKDEMVEAKKVWNGKGWTIVNSTDPQQGTVIIIRNGQAEGYYIPKDLAEVFNHTTSSSIMMGAKISRMITGSAIYRPLFTSLNLGFQTFNLARDFWRYWKNIPDVTFGELLISLPKAAKRYGQAVPHAIGTVKGKPTNLVKEMENSKILGLTFNDMFKNPEESDEKQIERVMKGAGITEATKRKGVLKLFYNLFDTVTDIGDIIEKLPKIAGYIELKGKMPEKELSHFIRNYLGSPNFRTGGTLTPITNNILMFSNAYKEGMKSDLKIATNYKTSGGKSTRSGFWWKTMFRTFLPKALMIATALGVFGDKLKKMMDNASEYDKTNYDILPLGTDENGKTIYMRIPQDETGRMLGGFFWKLSQLMTKDDKFQLAQIFQVIDFGAGQTPGLVPSWTGIGALVTYLSNRNPYDTFRGRNVIPENEFNAGVKYSFPIFMDWLIKQQGLGIVVPNYTPDGEVTTLESVIYKPVLSNIIGRWIKVSDYGTTEKYNEIKQQEQQVTSARLADEKKALKEAVKEYNSGKGGTSKSMILKKLIKDVVGDAPYRDTRKAKVTNITKKFNISILKESASSEVMSLIYANSNAQKIALLKEMKANMSLGEFMKLKKTLLDEGIVSKEVINSLNK